MSDESRKSFAKIPPVCGVYLHEWVQTRRNPLLLPRSPAMPKRVTVKTPVRRFSVKPRVELLEDRLVPAAMLPGFDGQTLAGNDDGSTGAVNLGFTLNFFGTSYSQVFVNNNGNITFGSASSQFTPSALTNSGQTPRIAAFFADVDTRAGNSVTYGTGTVDSHAAFAANWPGGLLRHSHRQTQQVPDRAGQPRGSRRRRLRYPTQLRSDP